MNTRPPVFGYAPLVVRITPGTLAALDALAERRDLTRSDLVRQAIADMLARASQPRGAVDGTPGHTS